jgi:hypothetical protein
MNTEISIVTLWLTLADRFDCSMPEKNPVLMGKSRLDGRMFPADLFETRQEFVHTEDGAVISAFIIHPKGIMMDRSHPTLLTVNGGTHCACRPICGYMFSRLENRRPYAIIIEGVETVVLPTVAKTSVR